MATGATFTINVRGLWGCSCPCSKSVTSRQHRSGRIHGRSLCRSWSFHIMVGPWRVRSTDYATFSHNIERLGWRACAVLYEEAGDEYSLILSMDFPLPRWVDFVLDSPEGHSVQVSSKSIYRKSRERTSDASDARICRPRHFPKRQGLLLGTPEPGSMLHFAALHHAVGRSAFDCCSEWCGP